MPEETVVRLKQCNDFTLMPTVRCNADPPTRLDQGGAGHIPVDKMWINRPPRRYFAHAK